MGESFNLRTLVGWWRTCRGWRAWPCGWFWSGVWTDTRENRR